MASSALTVSWFVEPVMQIRPCLLCKLQRVPDIVTGALALIGLSLQNATASVRSKFVFLFAWF